MELDFLNEILNNVSGYIFVLDKDGNIIFTNNDSTGLLNHPQIEENIKDILSV